jgi:hypothetical protein
LGGVAAILNAGVQRELCDIGILFAGKGGGAAGLFCADAPYDEAQAITTENAIDGLDSHQ